MSGAGFEPMVPAKDSPWGSEARGAEKARVMDDPWGEKTVFITGATGFIGAAVVPELLRAGYHLTCFARPASRIAALRELGLEVRIGDITDRDSIDKAMGRERIVIHLAGLTSELSSDLAHSRAVNVEGTRNMLAAASSRRVARFVHLSSESTRRKVRGAYAQTRLECDELLRASGVPYTILRPSITYGPGSRGLFQKTVGYIEGLPLVPIIGDGRQRIKPVHVEDVARALVACLGTERTLNAEYDLTGPDRLEFNVFIAAILSELGIRKRTVHLPFSLVYAGIKLVSAVMADPPVTTDNLLGLKQEVDMSFEGASRDFGYRPMPFPEGLRQTFFGAAAGTEPGRKNIAVVGLGKMGLVHASILNRIPEARLAALADVNPGLKGQLRSLGLSAPFFASVDTLLDKARLDGVFICTPPHLNAALSAPFLERGISVFVEKPMADSLAHAESMARLADEQKVKTACGYMLAHHPVFQKLKEIVGSGELGHVRSFESTCYISQVFRKKSARSTWHYDPRRTGGGVLLTMASHLAFLLCWYFGEGRVIRASAESFYTAMDDTVEADIQFGEGVAGRLKTSWSIKGYPELTVGLRLELDRAMVLAGPKLIRIEGRGGLPTSEIPLCRIRDESLFEAGGKGYYAQDREFVRSLSDGSQPIASWTRALQVQRLMDEIYRRSGDR